MCINNAVSCQITSILNTKPDYSITKMVRDLGTKTQAFRSLDRPHLVSTYKGSNFDRDSTSYGALAAES